MKKELRVFVHNKYSGHCGYCGKEITYKEMQVDHIKPQWKFRIYVDNIWNGLYRDGVNDIENLMPTCSRCNHYKREQDLEGFRKTMLTLHERVSKIYICKVAIDYGIVTITPFSGKFYFEELKQKEG